MSTISTMTDGGLVKSAIIKHGEYLMIPTEPLKGWFEHEYILITCSKTKNELKLIGIDNVVGFTFVDLIVYTDGDPTLLMLESKSLLPEGHELPWTSGICSPTPEMSKKIGLAENGCVWEGILKIPSDFPIDDLEARIKSNDKKGIIKAIDVKIIEKLEK